LSNQRIPETNVTLCVKLYFNQKEIKNSLSQEQGKPGTWTTLDKNRNENLHYLYRGSVSTAVLWSTKWVTTCREAMLQREAGAGPKGPRLSDS